MSFVPSPKQNKFVNDAMDLSRYNHLQVKFMRAERIYNHYLLQFANKVMDNVEDLNKPTKEDVAEALEKARKEFEQIQDALEAEKLYREVKMELDAEQGKEAEEFKPYFMQ